MICVSAIGYRYTFLKTHIPYICNMATKHTILYAEDDLDDVYILKQAFNKYSNAVNIAHARDGFETLQMLQELQAANQLPCLIVLDINMPGMDGRETLMRIKSDDTYKHIPVVLFTTSSSPLDKAFAEEWQVAFVTKPSVFAEFELLAKKFMELSGIEIPQQA
jgi:CheY-like chemotaxis protein